MGDQCAACCRAYNQHSETERAARLELERRFDRFKHEQFIRRESITRLNHALQDKTRALLHAEATIESLLITLHDWQKLALDQPNLPLHLAVGELSGLNDPLDVERLEELPEIAA
ncbi:MAG: hypothetical protein AABY68_05975 [Pseudomonadota bacterium]